MYSDKIKHVCGYAKAVQKHNTTVHLKYVFNLYLGIKIKCSGNMHITHNTCPNFSCH